MKDAIERGLQELITAGWAMKSDGHVDSPQGYFSIVPIDGAESDPIGTPLEDEESRKAVSYLPHGFYGVVEDTYGNVDVVGSYTELEATTWYERMEDAFMKWSEE